MSSKTTTISTFSLNAKDICSIIKACNDAYVSEITIGDVYISFNGAKSPENLTDVANILETGTRSVPFEPVTSEEDILTHKLLSNPSEYEEMVETE